MIPVEADFQVQIEKDEIIVYRFQKASADGKIPVPHAIMVPEYVIPLEPIMDAFPKMTLVDKLRLVYISAAYIEQERRVKSAEPEAKECPLCGGVHGPEGGVCTD